MENHRYVEAERHLAGADPVMARIIAERGPCTLDPDPRPFPMLVRSILGQQISVKAAASIRRRFADLLPAGEITAEGVLALSAEEMRGAGLSRPKARYVRDLAEKVSAGVVDLSTLSDLSDEDVVQALIQVNGIGRWTAEMFLIFSLGRPDVLSVGDLGIRTAAARAYALPAPATPEDLRAVAAPWQPYRSIACWYLWRTLDNLPVAPAAPAAPAGTPDWGR